MLGLASGVNCTDLTEAECNYILPLIQGMCHDYLTLRRIQTAASLPLTSANPGFYLLKNAILGLATMYIIRREYMKRTNRIEMAEFYMRLQPSLTANLKADLELVNQFIASSNLKDDSTL